MDVLIRIGLFLVGLVLFVGFTSIAIISYLQHEKRARHVSIILSLVSASFFFLVSGLPPTFRGAIFGLTVACGTALILLFFLPIGKVSSGQYEPTSRFDERDIMFARARLKPGSPEYQVYYKMRPENKAVDDRIRAKPGLLSPDSKFANPFLFASPEGSFGLTEALHEAVNGPVSADRQDLPS